jgi:Asparaginase
VVKVLYEDTAMKLVSSSSSSHVQPFAGQRSLQATQAERLSAPPHGFNPRPHRRCGVGWPGPGAHDTIAILALDADGHVAAATSTNGNCGKVPGRVGDAAVVGAGAYAVTGVGACGATGAASALPEHPLWLLSCCGAAPSETPKVRSPERQKQHSNCVHVVHAWQYVLQPLNVAADLARPLASMQATAT